MSDVTNFVLIGYQDVGVGYELIGIDTSRIQKLDKLPAAKAVPFRVLVRYIVILDQYLF